MPSGHTIVLIEDDREIASTIQNVLEGAGYGVLAAQNGVEGRRLIQDEQPDLVITDMMMPKMGGFPVLEFLKTLESPPKIIMITANEGGRHKAYAEMLGVAAYLRKPFAMDVMLEAVQDALEGKSQPAKKNTAAKTDPETETNAGRKESTTGKRGSGKKETNSNKSKKKKSDSKKQQEDDASGRSKLRRSARKKSS